MPLNKAVNVDASTATFGSYNPSVLSGGTLNLSSFLSAIRSNYIINGGGTITYNSSGFLAWGTRLIVISGGRGINGEFSTTGYFDINMPAVGTTIIGVGGAADRLVDSSGILINVWESLYYILPVGSNNASVAGNFRIVEYTANYDIPPNWVRIATRNGNDNRVYLHNGITLLAGQAYFASYTTVRPVLETLTSVSPASTIVPSVIRGASGQTGDLTQWQNSAATILTSINSSGHLSLPKINFTGGNTTISALTLADGTVSFEGTAGQLFSVSNSLTGTIFSINDISGLPSVEVTDLGIIKLNELYGQTVVGSGTPATNAQLSAIARTSTTIPLVARGTASQSANLQEWQNNTPTTVASIANSGNFTTAGTVSINTTGTGTLNLGDGTITKTSGSGFQLNSSISLNNSPIISSTTATTASIFVSTVTGITIGSSSIKTTSFPADGTTSTAAAGSGFMGMPQVVVSSGGRTLAASDAGKHIYMTTTSGQTVTIPANGTTAFPIGTTIVIINGNGISTTISINTDTLRQANTTNTGNRTLASNGMCTLVKINTTEWLVGGNGLS